MIGPEKPPLCAILCSESTPQKRRGSEGPFGIDSMKAAENCGDIQTLPARQKRWVVILPPISFVLTVASDANQASPNGSPSWEGTRSGAACHWHAALRFGFGRTRRDGWLFYRPSLLF